MGAVFAVSDYYTEYHIDDEIVLCLKEYTPNAANGVAAVLLNPIASEVFHGLKRSKDIDTIANELSAKYEATKEDIGKDIECMIYQLLDICVVESN